MKFYSVTVYVSVEAADEREAREKIYADLWPLYGDRDMDIVTVEDGYMEAFARGLRDTADALRSDAPDPLYFDAIGGEAYPASKSLVSVSMEARQRPYTEGREVIIRTGRAVLAGVGLGKVREWLARQR